jgi:hypothetical protein
LSSWITLISLFTRISFITLFSWRSLNTILTWITLWAFDITRRNSRHILFATCPC